jgi:uncharacterized protein YndB with AHSA1/START domain
MTQRLAPPTMQGLEQLQVAVSTRIFADKRRVFHALTIAEYFEAWMCFPDCREIDGIAVTQSARDFLIELQPSLLAHAGTKILGAHLIREPNQIVFTWAKQNGGPLMETTVCIHLEGSHRSTALNLSHMGFVDRKERVWHEDMWRASFEKLGHILQ